MVKKYSFDEKKSLANRIKKLNSLKDFDNIKKIILDNKDYPVKDYTKNESVYLIHFEKLPEKIYKDLENYLDIRARENTKKLMSEIESDYPDSEVVDSFVEEKDEKRYRLTHMENHILNRSKYDKEMSKNKENNELKSNSPIKKSSRLFVTKR